MQTCRFDCNNSYTYKYYITFFVTINIQKTQVGVQYTLISTLKVQNKTTHILLKMYGDNWD